jgi:hypothetical protein
MKHFALLLSTLPLLCHGLTNYVSLHGASVPPYTNLAMAATNIQLAVDYARDGDTVLVSNGLYNSGSRVSPNACLHSRVVITNAITLQSLNGPDLTAIVGAADPETGATGSNAVRGVYMSGGAHLCGFTVSNGMTSDSGEQGDMFGGGIYSPDSASITWCRVVHNDGGLGGGLSSLGSVFVANCLLAHNFGPLPAGCYANTGVFKNVIVTSNGYPHPWLPMGLVCEYGSIDASTICANHGSGIWIAPQISVRNCIIWGNQQQVYNAGSTSNTYCCIQDWLELTDGTISNDPQFVDAAAMDYRLRDSSPCINAGTNMPWMWAATDLDGAPRIQHGIVDMGCYESAVPEPFVLVALLLCLTALSKRAR